MKNKKSMTLSINFLVIMIIMIVLFGFGIYLFTTVFNKAMELDTEIHEKERTQLDMLLDSGEIVAVLHPQQTAGKDKDALRFPIGITNENGGAENNFKVVNLVLKFTDDDGNTGLPISLLEFGEIIQIPSDLTTPGFSIKNNQRVHRLLLVTPKHHGGFYTLTFNVQRQEGETPPRTWEDYGKKQMIWATVP